MEHFLGTAFKRRILRTIPNHILIIIKIYLEADNSFKEHTLQRKKYVFEKHLLKETKLTSTFLHMLVAKRRKNSKKIVKGFYF